MICLQVQPVESIVGAIKGKRLRAPNSQAQIADRSSSDNYRLFGKRRREYNNKNLPAPVGDKLGLSSFLLSTTNTYKSAVVCRLKRALRCVVCFERAKIIRLAGGDRGIVGRYLALSSGRPLKRQVADCRFKGRTPSLMNSIPIVQVTCCRCCSQCCIESHPM